MSDQSGLHTDTTLIGQLLMLIRQLLMLIRQLLMLIRQILMLIRQILMLIRQILTLIRQILTLIRQILMLIRQMLRHCSKLASTPVEVHFLSCMMHISMRPCTCCYCSISQMHHKSWRPGELQD